MSNQVVIGDLLYLTVPKDWIPTYHSLLYLLAASGKSIVDDCTFSCKGKGRNIFNCWNLFQSALAAKALGANKEAQFFIDYINAELKLYAKREGIVIPDISDNYPSCIYTLNDDGSYTFTITCIVDGVTYSREITIPGATYYYGASSAYDVSDLNLSDLISVSTSLVGRELTITTTDEEPYIWFVSSVPLSFVQAGLPLTLNEVTLNGIHYYYTDQLIAGNDNTFTINAS